LGFKALKMGAGATPAAHNTVVLSILDPR